MTRRVLFCVPLVVALLAVFPFSGIVSYSRACAAHPAQQCDCERSGRVCHCSTHQRAGFWSLEQTCGNPLNLGSPVAPAIAAVPQNDSVLLPVSVAPHSSNHDVAINEFAADTYSRGPPASV